MNSITAKNRVVEYSLNMNVIEKINSKYNFKIKQITHNRLYIDSGMDEWLLEIEYKRCRKHKNLVLFHKNHKRNTKQYHIQNRYLDYDWVFGAIHSHERRWFQSMNRMQRILDKINSLNINKVHS